MAQRKTSSFQWKGTMTSRSGVNPRKHIADIARELLNGRVGFLVGAGMSIPSGGMSGYNLIYDLILKSLLSELHDQVPSDVAKQLKEIAGKFPLEAVAEGVVPHLPFKQRALEEYLRNNVFGGKEPEPHDGHAAFASLLTRLRARTRTVFTTNWDSLLEDALGGFGKAITESTFRDTNDVIDSGKIAVIHLHGTFADNPVLKESELMNPDLPLFQIFLSELLTKAFVFVGYSLSDPNIRALYYRSGAMLKRSEKLDKTTYIVSPVSSNVEELLSHAVWEARNATFIPMGAVEFFQALYQETTTYALDSLKRRLYSRLSVSPEELQAKVDEIIRVFPSFEYPEQVLLYLDAITRGGRS